MAQQTPKMKRLIKNYRGYTFESSCFTTKDYRGGQNNWTDLEHLEGAISQMMQREYARKNQSRNEDHVKSHDYAA